MDDAWLDKFISDGVARDRTSVAAAKAALGPREKKAKTKSRGKPEAKVSVAVRSFIRYAMPSAFWFTITNETQGSDHEKHHLFARKAAGVVSGVPDLCVMWPGGGIAWLELKAGKNTASVQQNAIHAVMRECGQRVYVVWSADDAERALRDAGAPLRATTGWRIAAPVGPLAR